MIIGIDFDNTLASYDRLFCDIARRHGWISPRDYPVKSEIRDAVRRLEDGEKKWQAMQTIAYGERMVEAELIPGVADFIGCCREAGHEIFVVSHKTRYAVDGNDKIDLRQTALDWMTTKKFFSSEGLSLLRDHIFFEDSRANKCHRVGELKCAIFIDDLEEVFADPCFPRQVERILFRPQPSELPEGIFPIFASWDAIRRHVFGH